jgi:hypothetical protein
MNLSRAVSTILVLVALAAPGAAAPPRTPEAAVEAFYRFHFAKRDLMYLCRESVARERQWLTPKLHRLLVYELDRFDKAAAANGGPQNYKPFIAGDVFTHSEGPADAFRVAGAERAGQTARVRVFASWSAESEDGARELGMTVVVVRVGGRWLVDNVLYDDGDDLVDLLSRPDYESYGT